MDIVFNVSKGRVAHYGTLPLPSDALVVVPLRASGMPTDSTLESATTLAEVLGLASEQTEMGRKVIASGVAVNVDHVNRRVDVDITTDPVWSAATGPDVAALVVCYDADTGSGSDADLVPLTKHDFPFTPDGTDVVAQVAASGFYRAV